MPPPKKKGVNWPQKRKVGSVGPKANSPSQKRGYNSGPKKRGSISPKRVFRNRRIAPTGAYRGIAETIRLTPSEGLDVPSVAKRGVKKGVQKKCRAFSAKPLDNYNAR